MLCGAGILIDLVFAPVPFNTQLLPSANGQALLMGTSDLLVSFCSFVFLLVSIFTAIRASIFWASWIPGGASLMAVSWLGCLAGGDPFLDSEHDSSDAPERFDIDDWYLVFFMVVSILFVLG
jgi:hypothetical protein